MSGKLEALQRRTTVRKVLVARALAVVCSPSKRRLESAWEGQKVGVPAAVMRELAAEIEREYPGMIARCRGRVRKS